MSALFTIPFEPSFVVGQEVKAYVGALCGDAIYEEGRIVECVPAEDVWSNVSDPYRYRLEGRDRLFRESSIQAVVRPRDEIVAVA